MSLDNQSMQIYGLMGAVVVLAILVALLWFSDSDHDHIPDPAAHLHFAPLACAQKKKAETIFSSSDALKATYTAGTAEPAVNDKLVLELTGITAGDYYFQLLDKFMVPVAFTIDTASTVTNKVTLTGAADTLAPVAHIRVFKW